MSSLFAMELSLLPTNNNSNNSLTTTQRVQQLTSNPNLQTILKQQVNKSGYVTSAGYKAVLQQFLYNTAVGGDEMDCDHNNCNNNQPQHLNTAQSNRRRPRSISHDEASYNKNNNNNNNSTHRGSYNPRTSRRPRSINGSSRFGSIIQSTSNMTTSTMSSMTASITASMNNSKGSLNTSCLNGSLLNDSFFGGNIIGSSGKRGSLSGSLGMSKRSSLNGSGYSSYPIGTSMTSSTKRSSMSTSTNTRGGSTISSLTYSKRSTFETFTFDQQQDDSNSPHISSGGEMNNLAPRKRSDVSISQEQLDILRKERNDGSGGVRRSDIELRGSSNSRRARLKKLISVKFDPQDDDQEHDAVPPPPNNGKGRLTGRTFPKEVAVPPSSEDLNPSTSKDDAANNKDENSPVRRRRRNRNKDNKERKDKLLSQRQHQESLHSILSNPRDSITTNRTKSSEENEFDKSFDPQAFLNKLCEEGKSCAQGGVPSDTNKKLCDMMNKKKNVWLPWPSKKSLLRTSSSADSNDDSISLSSVMSADDDDDGEEDMSKLFNSSSCGGEGGWLSWPDQSSSRSLGKTTKEKVRTKVTKKLSSDSTTQPVTTLPLSSTSCSIKSSRARAA